MLSPITEKPFSIITNQNSSTAFPVVGVPDPIFSGPSIKEKIAVWLRETNLQTGYKTKLVKRGEAGQQCKKHMPIAFSGKYTIKFALAV